MDRTPWIQNVSMQRIKEGFHFFEPHKTILIQIQDPASILCTPKHKDRFVEVHQFFFDDIEENDIGWPIQPEDAKNLAFILRDAFSRGMNIVVHCHAGLCRSGAVAECGVFIGFDDTEMPRIPNLLVKKAILKELGFSYDYN